jgi:hypothetical protein
MPERAGPPPAPSAGERDELVATAHRIIDDIVYASLATVGPAPDHRPRSRIVHPVWDWGTDPVVGWVTTKPTPIKLRHLAANPHASFLYWSPAHDVVTIDADVHQVDDDQERREIWERIAATGPPVGFDPTTLWPGGPTSPDYGVLLARPTRLTVRTAAAMADGRPVRVVHL